MKNMTLEEFRTDVLTAMKNKPKEWRDGQFVFNYIDEKYRVARYVQFIEDVDCFHNDNNIESFIARSYETFMAAKTNNDAFETVDTDSNV